MPRSTTSTSPEGPLHVLVIEDDLIFQKIIQTYLHQAAGCRTSVVLVGRLADGLEQLASQPIDAVLLDLTLPDSEGLDTLERFQAGAPGVPVIVLTGLDDDEVAAEAVHRGAQDFLVKSDLNASILTRSVRYAIERTHSEAALRASESRFRAVVEDQTELVCRYRPDGALTFVNRAFCRYFGRDQDELLGRSFFELIGVEADQLTDLGPGMPTRSREQQLVLDRSSAAWIQWTDRALFDVRDQLTELQSVGRDTTEQKQLEQQLYHSQKMETLGRLAGGVAHDFNNLLTVIIACCEMLAAERDMAGAAPHPQIAEIGKAAERAAALTRQLLAVSRRHIAQSAVLDLNRVVRQTEEMLRRLIGEQVTLAVRLADGLWPIRADRAQLEQILVNLVVNARDAMPEGGQVTIATATAAGGEQHFSELVVADTGVGMDLETREKLFEPFFTTKEAGRGTGLGLSIVDSLVKQSNGSITVESVPRLGTSFRIRFPATDEELDETAAAVTVDDALLGRRRSGSILLVEDEALVRDVVISLLEPQGYRVLGAGSAGEALKHLENGRSETFDVILTDVVLPDRNGFQLAAEVRARFPRMRILFMSGYTDSSVGGEKWLESGTHFLQKPFSADQLLSKLDKVLRGS